MGRLGDAQPKIYYTVYVMCICIIMISVVVINVVFPFQGMSTLVLTLVATEVAVGSMAGQRNCSSAGPSLGLSLHSWRTGETKSIDLGCLIVQMRL